MLWSEGAGWHAHRPFPRAAVPHRHSRTGRRHAAERRLNRDGLRCVPASWLLQQPLQLIELFLLCRAHRERCLACPSAGDDPEPLPGRTAGRTGRTRHPAGRGYRGDPCGGLAAGKDQDAVEARDTVARGGAWSRQVPAGPTEQGAQGFGLRYVNQLQGHRLGVQFVGVDDRGVPDPAPFGKNVGDQTSWARIVTRPLAIDSSSSLAQANGAVSAAASTPMDACLQTRPKAFHSIKDSIRRTWHEKHSMKSGDSPVFSRCGKHQPERDNARPAAAAWGWQVDAQARCTRAALNPAWTALLLGREFPIRSLVRLASRAQHRSRCNAGLCVDPLGPHKGPRGVRGEAPSEY